MGTYAAASRGTRSGILGRLGILLLAAGFCGHFFAARAIGGTYLAYRDHLAGYFGIAIITGAIIVLLGRKFWRGRPDLTLFIIGFIQAAIGIYIYINRFSVHG